MAPSKSVAVRIAPLGGLGEIGLNLMVLACGGSALVIDAGVMFPPEREFGGGLLIPEMRYLADSALKLEGVVLTHAHEDHIGALPYLLERFPAPVYGTPVTVAFVHRSQAEHDFDSADLRTITPGTTFDLGPFKIEPLRVTHSTPDSVALAIRTPAGLIVHSGDFKIDPAPVDGVHFDRDRFAQLGEEGVDLLLSDSTNVERQGRTPSESSLKPILRDLVTRTRGRFFLSSFSSHIHRIRQVAEIAHEAGRYVVPLGRRMAQSVRIGIETGQLNLPPGVFIEPAEADFLEPRRLVYIAGGSQAEPSSSMARLAGDTHPTVHIDERDLVVLSSRFIPGNERTINELVNQLCKRGAQVYYQAVANVHVSGHASRDELSELIRLVRPRHFVPIHGEYRHLARHLEVAAEAGVPVSNCHLLENGDTLVMTGGDVRRGRLVPVGRVAAEGEGHGAPGLIRERRALAHDGTVIAVVAISSRTGEILAGPDLISRGVVGMDGAANLARAKAEVRDRLRSLNGTLRHNDEQVRHEMTRALRRYFSDTTGRRPLIVPYVMEV